MKGKVIVVGGGLAGLAATMLLAEAGYRVDLVSLTKVKRSHSVCAQGGINAALNLKNEGDSPLLHAYETIKGGDFLADQPPVVSMCLTAPRIIQLLDRLGCPFNRTSEGRLDVRRFGGSLFNRTLFSGASTGQQLMYTLDEQVRRFEAKGLVTKYENHEFLRLIQDDNGRAVGIVLQDLFNQKITPMTGDAVVIATGGLGVLFKKSTNSTFCTGAASGRLFLQGALYANGEFVQIHPTAIPGEDKLRLMSESARGEGGRIWVYGDSSKSIQAPDGRIIQCGKTGEPWYFLEELYPAYGNLVPRDIAAREILRICELGLGIEGKSQVFLDVSHLPPEKLKRLEAILEIYQKFTGTSPSSVPMRIFPAVHYSMGGLWVDWPAQEDSDREVRFRQMSNIEGCFVVGEADFQYHGANRLGANSLLSCIFSGFTAAREIPRFIEQKKRVDSAKCERFSLHAVQAEEDRRESILKRDGGENVHALHDELASMLVQNVTVKRNNRDLQKTLEKIYEIKDRFEKISLSDRGRILNQTYIFANQFESMIALAQLITHGALLRNESRGSHAKEEFPQRNDETWLKTTIAAYKGPAQKGYDIHYSYKAVDCRYIKPVLRDYTKASKSLPEFEGLPDSIELPI